MSDFLLTNSAVASLSLALRREAQRAFEAQHLPVDERQTLQALLAARALPLVLDLLLLDKSEWNLSLLEFDGVEVKLHRQPEQDALLAFAEHKIGSHRVRIHFIEENQVDREMKLEPQKERIDANLAFATVHFYLTERSVDEVEQDTVIIRRFSFNGPQEQTRPGR